MTTCLRLLRSVILSLALAPAPALAAALTLGYANGPPRAELSVSGTGFTANSAVDVYWDFQQVGMVFANGSGAFSAFKFRIPAGATPGAHTVTGLNRNAATGAQKTFTVRSNWTRWRYDNVGRAFNHLENVLVGGAVADAGEAIKFSTAGGAVSSAPVRYQAQLLAQTGNTLVAWDYATGTKNYEVSAPANTSTLITPAVANNGYVLVSGDNSLRAYKHLTGELVWQATLGGSTRVSPPNVLGGTAYVTALLGSTPAVYAFTVTCGSGGATCTPLWKGTLPSGSANMSVPPPIIGDSRVYVRTIDKVHAFLLACGTGGATCTANWTSASVITTATTPLYWDGRVFVTGAPSLVSGDLRLHALNSRTGALIWSGLTGSPISVSSPAMAHDRIYVTNGSDIRSFASSGCTSSCDGTLVTSFLRENFAELSIAGDVIYAQTPTILAAFSLWAGSTEPLWTASVGTLNTTPASPIIVDGVIYAATDTSYVWSYSLSPNVEPKRQPQLWELRPSPQFE